MGNAIRYHNHSANKHGSKIDLWMLKDDGTLIALRTDNQDELHVGCRLYQSGDFRFRTDIEIFFKTISCPPPN
jgi:hypothetical protein